MDYRKELNENQYKAVTSNAQYARVVAGAGSGKTRVLTYRLAYLVGEKNVDPRSIVAIAFTNKVAGEMKTRAINLLNNKGQGISVSTFHSFCARFLRQEIDCIGFPNSFLIMDEDDQEKLIKDIAVEDGFKRKDSIVSYTISFISYYKCVGMYPEDIPTKNIKSEADKKALKFFHEYENRKSKMYCLDFDDLLLKTIEILETNDFVRQKWQNRISNILVDEFQDTNDVQYKLIKLLLKPSTSLYVVGDPDQTIYTWRGANQDIIINFERDFPLAETIILNENYRSTKKILDCANKLIANNKKRVPKDLFTNNIGGEDVELISSFSREEEAHKIADKIEELHYRGVDYSKIAVLYRASYLTLPFENEFMQRRIPYRVFGGQKFFQRKEIKDVLAYFRILYNVKDDISFERIVNVPRRGFGDTSLDLLKAEKEELGLSYLEYISDIDKYETSLKPRHTTQLVLLNNKLNATRNKLKENEEAYPKILDDFIRDIGYYDYLQSEDDKAEERQENVKALFDNIIAFLKQNPSSTFDEYLENATLQSAQDEVDNNDQVSLMTVHVAKGLEYNYIFVVSFIEGVFPLARSLEENGPDGLEEERRLAYVAFTRAQKKLFVSYNSGYSFVMGSKGAPSRFVNEANLAKNNDMYYKQKPFSPFTDNNVSFDDIISQIQQDDAPKTNNIFDWRVGDIAYHDKFGKGIVTKVIDDTIIEVNFEECGRKNLVSTHPKLHRVEEGAKA